MSLSVIPPVKRETAKLPSTLPCHGPSRVYPHILQKFILRGKAVYGLGKVVSGTDFSRTNNPKNFVLHICILWLY